jgi:hypothetical protein
MSKNKNRAMIPRKPGCMNDIAYKRAHSRCDLSHPNFAALSRREQPAGTLTQDKGGRKTYIYE